MAKQNVLFICIHNSARSQMAEAWLNEICGHHFAAESAGLERGTLNPLVVEAMEEVGIDISQKKTQAVFDVFKAGKLFSYVITVCDETSAERCPIFPGVPAWAWLVGFISFNGFVNFLGIEFTARVNRYMLIMELATLGLFVVLGLTALYGGAGAGALTLQPIYDPQVFSAATVAGATSIAVLSFLGFDGISTLAEESRGNQGAVGRATVLSLALIGALFMLQTWIATDLARGMHFASSDTAFYEVAQRAGGPPLRLITILATVIASAIANAMAAQAAVSRILFAMARDGKLPALLARVHPRYQTPYVSTLAVALVSLMVGLFFADHLDDLSRVVNFGALTGFVLLHLSVITHYFIRSRSGDWLRHVVCPLTGLSIIVYVLYEMDRAAKILGVCWIAMGILYYLLLALRGKKSAVLEI